MCKQEFLDRLKTYLSGLPQRDVEERLAFYNEMIDDRIEEGLSEFDAVAEIGTVESVVAQIIEETPFLKLAKEKIKPQRRLRAWEIVLLAVGSPIWLSLIIAAFAVVFSLYVALWSVIIALWSSFVSLSACGIAGVASGIGFACAGTSIAGFALIGLGLVCAGLSLFLFYGCKAATKGTLKLTRKMALGFKKSFVKRRDCE